MSHAPSPQEVNGNKPCIFSQITNPFECHTIHRDVKELREEYKEILKILSALEKSIAINTTKSAIISSLVTTIVCGILVSLGSKFLSLL